MIEFISTNSVAGIAVLTPIILALVQVAKEAGVSSKYASLVSVACGMVLSVVLLSFTLPQDIIIGLLAGLSASGAYSGGKAITEPKKEDDQVIDI